MWSNPNKLRVKELIAEGRMTSAGRVVLSSSLEPSPRLEVPPYLEEVLSSNLEVKSFFDSLTVNQQDMYVHWINSAKMKETRDRRIRKLIQRLREKKKPGIV